VRFVETVERRCGCHRRGGYGVPARRLHAPAGHPDPGTL